MFNIGRSQHITLAVTPDKMVVTISACRLLNRGARQITKQHSRNAIISNRIVLRQQKKADYEDESVGPMVRRKYEIQQTPLV